MKKRLSFICLSLMFLSVFLCVRRLHLYLYENGYRSVKYDQLVTNVRTWEKCYCSAGDGQPIRWTANSSCSMRHMALEPSTRNNVTVKPPSYKVPNFVHYTWFHSEKVTFKFHNMLSVLSAYKFIKPDIIYFHTNNEPIGKYWEKVKRLSTLNVTYRNPVNTVYDINIRSPFYETSESNVERVKILAEYGGIYMDLDYIALNSFDPLRTYPCTIGYESKGRVCGGCIVCAKDSPFLHMWIKSYADDYRTAWAYNTGLVPVHLALRCPNLVHIEQRKLHHPNYFAKELSELLDRAKTWKWRENYGVHLWYRKWNGWIKNHPNASMRSVNQDSESVKTLNTTFGEIARTILYDIANL